MFGHIEDTQQTDRGVEGKAPQVGARPLQITGDQMVHHAAWLIKVGNKVGNAILHPDRNVAGIGMYHRTCHIGLQHIIVDRPHGPVGPLEGIARIGRRTGGTRIIHAGIEIQTLWARLGWATGTASQQEGCQYGP